MSDTTKQIIREILKEFIKIYKNEPCLWRIKSKDYHDRNKKTAAYNRLIDEYRRIDPHADREVVVKKLNALRTNYRKEKKKIEESRQSGASPFNVYVPNLWYYNLMTFLDNDLRMPMPKQTVKNEDDDSLQENEAVFLDTGNIDDSSSEPDYTFEETSSPRIPSKRKRSNSTELSNEVLNNLNEYFKRPVPNDDRFDLFGKKVAIKLRDLPKKQRMLAEKIINDTLFEAEMGNLKFPFTN